MRPLYLVLLVVALAAISGLAACSEEEAPTSPPPDYEAALAGAPAKLAAIYGQGNQLLDGGKQAFEGQIEELRGFPIVVNFWASWCGPCIAEFPHFQQASARLGKKVAFLAVNPDDSEDSASTFLRDNPVPYPSFTDPDRKIATPLVAHYLPATVFYDRQGNTFTKHGMYTSEEQLIADIEAHALGTG